MSMESEFPPMVGGKNGFKLKDLKTALKKWSQKPGNAGRSWRTKRKEGVVKK